MGLNPFVYINFDNGIVTASDCEKYQTDILMKC